jgi:small-conductance mechanosensitive channel
MLYSYRPQVVIAILIVAVALEAQVATLVTSAGTLVLGLSWLIGGTLAEVLTSKQLFL